MLIVNNVLPLSVTSARASSALTEKDVKDIKELAQRKDLFSLMARSIAPSIEGHEYIKKAVLLLMLGGIEKNLENGSHIRGSVRRLHSAPRGAAQH